MLKRWHAAFLRFCCRLVGGHRWGSGYVCIDCGTVSYVQRMRLATQAMTVSIGAALIPAFRKMTVAAQGFNDSMERLQAVLASVPSAGADNS